MIYLHDHEHLPHDGFAIMYGTKKYAINQDAQIINLVTGNIVLDPWKTFVPPTKRLTFTDDTGCTATFTLPQFMIYTYMGVIPNAKVLVRYPSEPPILSNCYYAGSLNREKCIPGKVMYIGDEEFRKCGASNRTGYAAYISKYGVTISVVVQNDHMYLNYGAWEYREGYPFGLLPGVREAIHRMVWDVWGDRPQTAGMDVHHKDRNRWNPSIQNLALLSKPDHRAEHAKRTNQVRYTKDDVEYVIASTLDKTPKHEIVNTLALRNGGSHVSAARFVHNIQTKRAYQNLTEGYDFSDYPKHIGNKIEWSPERATEACELLMDDKISDLEIARRTGVSYAVIGKIRRGEYDRIRDRTTREIAKMYDGRILKEVHQDGRFKRALDEEAIRRLVDLRQRTNWTNEEIGNELGCSSETVRFVVNGIKQYAAYGPVECAFTESERRRSKGVRLMLDENDPRVVEIRKRMKKF